jgi:sensor histidine kinase YesM
MKLFVFCIFFILIFSVGIVSLMINIIQKEIYFNSLTMDMLVAGIVPLKTYKNLFSPENFRSELHKLGGVYGLINTADSNNIKQYEYNLQLNQTSEEKIFFC